MSAQWGNMGAPASEGAAVTPSDTTLIGGSDGARFLFVEVAGDLAVTLQGPSATVITLHGVLKGAWIPLRCSKVMAATTATVIAFW